MNSVSLVGRLTRDPDVKYTQGDEPMVIARFTVACDRRVKKDDKGQSADFISCVAFGKTGEFLEKYFHKGMRIGLNGRIQTGNFTNKNGEKVYTTDIVCENVEFVESKKEASDNTDNEFTSDTKGDTDGFMNVPDDEFSDIDEALPFR